MLTFDELEEWTLYKKKNSYNDQLYMKVPHPRKQEYMLLTCSGCSLGKFLVSSASRTEPNFLFLNARLKTRETHMLKDA